MKNLKEKNKSIIEKKEDIMNYDVKNGETKKEVRSMSKSVMEKFLLQLEIDKNKIIKALSQLECDNGVDLISKFTNTREWETLDEYFYNELSKQYRNVIVNIDHYKKQLKKLKREMKKEKARLEKQG